MLPTLAMALSTAIAAAASSPAAIPDDRRTDEAFAQLAERRVFFGHQSVGANVLEGVARMSAARGTPVRVSEIAAPGASLARGTFAHVYVGTNGDAEGKLRSFSEALAALQQPPDVALVKLCWADFGPSTDVERLFRAYEGHMAELAKRYPGTRFVHVTVPLTTVQSGPKAWVKTLLGRAPYGAVENQSREAFNARLRAAYDGKQPLFDLARIEATAPDGSLTTHEWEGRETLALAAQYTDDGGHLTPPAQDRVARALAVYLAALP
jgi:hypothetical protein